MQKPIVKASEVTERNALIEKIERNAIAIKEHTRAIEEHAIAIEEHRIKFERCLQLQIQYIQRLGELENSLTREV